MQNKPSIRFLNKQLKDMTELQKTMAKFRKSIVRDWYWFFLPGDIIFFLMIFAGFVALFWIPAIQFWIPRFIISLSLGIGMGQAITSIMKDYRWYKDMLKRHDDLAKCLDEQKERVRQMKHDLQIERVAAPLLKTKRHEKTR